MSTYHEIFIAALNAINQQHGDQTAVAKATGLTPQKINNMLAGIRKSTEDERRAIAAFYKHSYQSFLNIGRAALGLPLAAKTAPPSPEVAEYLTKARKVLEGPEAELFKGMVDKFDRPDGAT